MFDTHKQPLPEPSDPAHCINSLHGRNNDIVYVNRENAKEADQVGATVDVQEPTAMFDQHAEAAKRYWVGGVVAECIGAIDEYGAIRDLCNDLMPQGIGRTVLGIVLIGGGEYLRRKGRKLQHQHSHEGSDDRI